jgi:hypothetical protein
MEELVGWLTSELSGRQAGRNTEQHVDKQRSVSENQAHTRIWSSMSAGRGGYRQAGRQEYGAACRQAEKRIGRQAGKNMEQHVGRQRSV